MKRSRQMGLVGIAGLRDDIEDRCAIFQEPQRLPGTVDLPDQAERQTGRVQHPAPHGS
jgi:hypothetical protein